MNTRHFIALLVLFVVGLTFPTVCIAQPTYRPSDPIASIDSSPVFLGELNYLLRIKLKAKDISRVPINVQRASSALLVRQHQALHSLKAMGGEGLQSILDRSWSAFESDLRRQGTTVAQYCKRYQSNVDSVRNSHDWDTAWRAYLKSKLTDANLKLYYIRHADRYANTAWDVSHLFLPVDPKDPDSDSIAQQRMNRIVSELESATSASQRSQRFAELAREESEGSTASEGGRIGWVSKPGDLPTKVMSALRQTQVDSVSQPVSSPLGIHLLLVHDKKSQQVPYDQVRDQAPIRKDAAMALFDALVEKNSQSNVIWYIKQLRPPQAESSTTP